MVCSSSEHSFKPVGVKSDYIWLRWSVYCS